MKTALLLPLALAATFASGAAPATDCCPACSQALGQGAYSRASLYRLDASFTDDGGRPVSLGSFRGRPVVLDMFFASCSNACPLTVTDMLAVQRSLPTSQRGRVVFVLVSFDDQKDTPEALARYRAQRRLDGNWVLLHGDGQSVRELAALLGVKYKRSQDGAYAHSNLLTVLNAAGEIVHQRIGLVGGLDQVAGALVAAAPQAR